MASDFRICVTGGRDYDDRQTVNEVLGYVAGKMAKSAIKLAHGGATGADTLARDWAYTTLGCENVRQFNAYWDLDGPSAGPKRNARMLDEFKPHVLIVFPGGVGTADCVQKAKARAIPTRWAEELVKKSKEAA